MSYISALYELSEEVSVLSEVYDAAAILKESLLIVPEYLHMLSSPVLPLAVRLENIREALMDAPEILRNTVLLLCEKNEIDSLVHILEGFIHMYEQKNGILRITACSAYPLNVRLVKRLEDVLQKRFQKQIRLEYEVHPRYIGGLMIKTKEFQYDGTVAAKIEDIGVLLSDDTNISVR